MPGGAKPLPLTWGELTPPVREALTGRLAGLYGAASDPAAFDALAVDKQRALLIFVEALGRLNFWREVSRVTNVYGEGGVGIEFEAARGFSKRLRRTGLFTTRFARHRGTAEGYSERGRRTAALHFLRALPRERLWAAHFDLHAPAASPRSALRHLWHEKLRRRTPDWREIAGELGLDGSGWTV
ncbi:MAG: hypothetical protein LC785_11205 [Acidobacteria bacterium]|nr:hypothetical protein [Acidobacteriota bacterium]MCA1642493.1 hypothetical protein [Acidobacteriota bacterium]